MNTDALRKRINSGNDFVLMGLGEQNLCLDEIDRLRAEVATARALAMEEAKLKFRELWSKADEGTGIEDLDPQFVENEITALAPLPSGLVAVERVILKKLVDDLGMARLALDPPLVVGRIGGDPAEWVVASVIKGQKVIEQVQAALSTALKEPTK